MRIALIALSVLALGCEAGDPNNNTGGSGGDGATGGAGGTGGSGGSGATGGGGGSGNAGGSGGDPAVLTEYCDDYCTCVSCSSDAEELCVINGGFTFDLAAIDGCDTVLTALLTCWNANTTCVEATFQLDPIAACAEEQEDVDSCVSTNYGNIPLTVLAGGQAPACAQMIACDIAWGAADDTRDAYYTVDDSSYGVDGTCWSTSAASAEACASACASALEGYILGVEAAVTAGNLEAVPTECTETPPPAGPLTLSLSSLGGDAAYCDDVCACTACNTDRRQLCEVIGEYQARLAVVAGCGSYFTAATTCAATELVCDDVANEVSLPDQACDDEAGDLASCLGGTTLPNSSGPVFSRPQAPACAAMIACDIAWGAADDTRDAYFTVDDSAYGENGTCWSTSPEAAEACASACESALEGYIAGAEAAVTAGNLDALPSECAMP